MELDEKRERCISFLLGGQIAAHEEVLDYELFASVGLEDEARVEHTHHSFRTLQLTRHQQSHWIIGPIGYLCHMIKYGANSNG